MVWKNGKTGFHGVELFPKLASMVWKNGENGFHAVELFAPQGKTTTPQGEGAAPSAPPEGEREEGGREELAQGRRQAKAQRVFAQKDKKRKPPPPSTARERAPIVWNFMRGNEK